MCFEVGNKIIIIVPWNVRGGASSLQTGTQCQERYYSLKLLILRRIWYGLKRGLNTSPTIRNRLNCRSFSTVGIALGEDGGRSTMQGYKLARSPIWLYHLFIVHQIYVVHYLIFWHIWAASAQHFLLLAAQVHCLCKRIFLYDTQKYLSR